MRTGAGVRVSLSGRTDLGRTRDHNEDTFLVADLSADRAELAPDVRDHEVGERGSLLLVADGMGGAAAGELASSMAAGEILDYLRRVWSDDPSPSGPLFARRMREAVEHANRRLHEYATAHPEVICSLDRGIVAGMFGALSFNCDPVVIPHKALEDDCVTRVPVSIRAS